MNILVSACLLGTNCKYNGGNNLTPKLMELKKENIFIPVCPEESGGLLTPREPCEIQNGMGKDVLEGKSRVINKTGDDVTESFILGAKETLALAKQHSCPLAVLKSRSPSCGCGVIYDGTFSGELIEGNGVTAQMLLDNEIVVMTEKDFE